MARVQQVGPLTVVTAGGAAFHDDLVLATLVRELLCCERAFAAGVPDALVHAIGLLQGAKAEGIELDIPAWILDAAVQLVRPRSGPARRGRHASSPARRLDDLRDYVRFACVEFCRREPGLRRRPWAAALSILKAGDSCLSSVKALKAAHARTSVRLLIDPLRYYPLFPHRCFGGVDLDAAFRAGLTVRFERALTPR